MVLNIISIGCNSRVFSVGVKIGEFYYYTEIFGINNINSLVVIINNLFLYYSISFIDIDLVLYNISIKNYLSINLFFIILYGMFSKKNVILCDINFLCFIFYFNILESKTYLHPYVFANGLIFLYFFKFKKIIIKKEIFFSKKYYYGDIFPLYNITYEKYDIVGIFNVLRGVYCKINRFIL